MITHISFESRKRKVFEILEHLPYIPENSNGVGKWVESNLSDFNLNIYLY